MPIEGTYLGMPLAIADVDGENRDYFRFCAQHDFRLQRCARCDLLRYPPTTGCPWCGSAEAVWSPVQGRGSVHSYGEVHHPIQPAFRGRTPYLILLVDLDEQQGQPTEHEALRLIGNLVTPTGDLAPPDLLQRVGIGSRVRLVFVDVADGLAIPQWTLDESAEQPASPWRYPYD